MTLITKIYNQNEIRNNSKEIAIEIWENVKDLSGQNIDANTSGTSYSIYFTVRYLFISFKNILLNKFFYF